MKLKSSQNTSLKINTTQSNIEYPNKETKTDFNPYFNQKSFSPSTNLNLKQDLNNKYQAQNMDFPNTTQDIQAQIDGQIISNFKVKPFYIIKMPKGLKEDFSLKNNFESLFKKNNYNYNKYQNNNNKFIKPIHYNELKDSNIIIQNEKEILNESLKQKNQGRINYKENSKLKNRHFFNTFKVYHIKPKKRKIQLSFKKKQQRKYKPDDIRKKIKARFHKSIKNIVNENLRKAGSNKIFTFLPQIFISSVSREKNHKLLNMSYRDLIKKDFLSDLDEKKYKNKWVDLIKYKNNLKVLEYLDENPDICERSGFDIISKMKYRDLLEEYFKSDEFENSINKLRQENEEEGYIKEYINKSKNYVKFYSEIKKKKIKKRNEISIEIKDNDNSK